MIKLLLLSIVLMATLSEGSSRKVPNASECASLLSSSNSLPGRKASEKKAQLRRRKALVAHKAQDAPLPPTQQVKLNYGKYGNPLVPNH
jgi:hypothetical protein